MCGSAHIPVTPENAGFSKSRSVHILGSKLPHPCSRPLPASMQAKLPRPAHAPYIRPVCNEEDGRLLACPLGASVENQSFVVALKNDQSLSTSDALIWIPTEALKSRISRCHGYIIKTIKLKF